MAKNFQACGTCHASLWAYGQDGSQTAPWTPGGGCKCYQSERVSNTCNLNSKFMRISVFESIHPEDFRQMASDTPCAIILNHMKHCVGCQ